MRLHNLTLRPWQRKILLQVISLLFISVTFAQKMNLTGTVTDGNAPLEKVSVSIAGSPGGTTSDEKGVFKIAVTKGQTLIFSYLGFEEKRIVAGDHSVIAVSLQKSAQSTLDDVVVVGYGTEKKVNLTGAVSTVSAKQLEDRPVTSVSSALQGTMAGVTVVQNSGQPGNDYGTIRVRGIGTLSNSDAMVVVDGVVSTMNDINPNDIETITVLKDAASASIYGSRGANGVILITTKKGKAGKTLIHYNAYVGQQKANRLPDYLPSWQGASFYNEALQNEGQNPRYTDAEVQTFKDGSDPDNYPNTDWLNLFYKGSGLQQNHFFDISGGNDKVQNFLSLGYFQQDGIVKGSDLSRYTVRYKMTNKLSSVFTLNGNFSYNFENSEEPTNPYTGQFNTYFWEVNRISRSVPYKYSNGYYGYFDDGNPIAWLDEGARNKYRAYYLRGSADGELKIAKGLSFKPLLGYQLTLNQAKDFIKDIQFYNWQTGAPTYYEGPNSLTENSATTTVVTLQGLFQYDHKWGDHSFSALAGYSQEYTNYSFLQGYRKSFLNNSLNELNAGPVTGQQATGTSNELALQSAFGRINYNYKSKYLLEGNIRYDGSSRFASQNRWGVFPSFSGGWRISEEPFFEPVTPVVSELKLRGSWGILGNQNIGSNYAYIPTISSGQNYALGGAVVNGVAPLNGANEGIQWETTKSTDIGLDAGFLKRKITLTVNYFIRNTSNMLLNIPTGSVYGFNAPVQNAGSVQNKGFELELGYHGRSKDFTYDIMGNASFIRNNVTNLAGTDPIVTGATYLKVGRPINSLYGYQAEGIFQTQDQINKHATQSGGVIAPGDIMYKDQNGDGVINGDDRVYLGTFFPKIAYGITGNLGWKGFDFTLFLQGAAGLKNIISGPIMGMVGDKDGKPTSIFAEHWTAANPTDKFPRLWSSYTQNDPAQNPSSFWVRNAGYMRVKNIQLGYTLPIGWTTRAGIQKVRIYYSGQNILTFSKFYNWVDPEAPAAESGYSYPQVKVNTVGVNVTF